MNRAFLLTALTLALSLTLGMGCLGEAPHDNPLDPNSDDFIEATEGDVDGRITDRANEPLSDAEVRLILTSPTAQIERVAQTDGQGAFSMTAVPQAAGYRLLASKDGYEIGMLEGIDVRAGETTQLSTVRLNALPTITEAAFRTIHISRWWPTNDLFFLEVDVQADDADGLFDINDLVFEIPELNFAVPLDPRIAGRFDKRIRADSLPTTSLFNLLGRTLRLTVRDREGAVASSSQQLVRVVEGTPTTVSPPRNAIIDNGLPLLTWDPFPPQFPFTYRIDIFRDESNVIIPVDQFPGIAMDVISQQVRIPLPTGSYLWTVTVVDEFGNESRSKEGGFRIP